MCLRAARRNLAIASSLLNAMRGLSRTVDQEGPAFMLAERARGDEWNEEEDFASEVEVRESV